MLEPEQPRRVKASPEPKFNPSIGKAAAPNPVYPQTPTDKFGWEHCGMELMCEYRHYSDHGKKVVSTILEQMINALRETQVHHQPWPIMDPNRPKGSDNGWVVEPADASAWLTDAILGTMSKSTRLRQHGYPNEVELNVYLKDIEDKFSQELREGIDVDKQHFQTRPVLGRMFRDAFWPSNNTWSTMKEHNMYIAYAAPQQAEDVVTLFG